MALALRNGRRIHYDVAPAEGSGSEATAIATPVVLIPGLGGGARMFGTLPRRFARRGFPCITFDPVGVAPSVGVDPRRLRRRRVRRRTVLRGRE